MKKVTVNGVDHELSPDSPRSRSHVELLQDMVTSINNLETGTSPDGLELTSADAAVNVITTASDNTTTTGSVAALTFKNTVEHATSDLEYNFTRSDDTSLLKIDKEGDTTIAGGLTCTTVTASGALSAAGISSSGATTALTSTSANVITSATSAANATASVAALTVKPTTVLDAGDLILNVTNSADASRLAVDAEGDVTAAGGLTCTTVTASSTVRGNAFYADSGALLSYAAVSATVGGNAANSGTNVGVILDNAQALTGNTKLVSIRNAAVEKSYINSDGNYVNLNVTGTAGSGTGISAVRTAQVRHVVHAVTVTEAALTDADTSQAVTIWTVPAKTRILRIVADVTAAFTGGGVTACTLQVGISGGDTDAYLSAFDCLSGATTKGLVEADLGVALANGGSGAGAFPDFTTTKALAVQFDSTTANVADLTAGSVTFYIECVSY